MVELKVPKIFSVAIPTLKNFSGLLHGSITLKAKTETMQIVLIYSK